MAYYDDPEYQYSDFWKTRLYEHQSEILALERLVGSRKVKVGVDVGGGFGRLTTWLIKRCDKVFLVEPSAKMRSLARKKLGGNSKVVIRPGFAEDTNLPNSVADLVVMVRVMHHLPQPSRTLLEMYRILKPGGYLVIEFASSTHALARLKSWVTRKPILPIPVERRSAERIAAGAISFVNHYPLTIKKLLIHNHFKIVDSLSVSNFRMSLAKKYVPHNILVGLESKLQKPLASVYFGPSMFLLAKKA